MPRGFTPLGATALLHVVLAVACAIALALPATPVLGIHPAYKPLKFAMSIALLLGTFAVVLRYAETTALTTVASWVLAATMLLEMVLIVVQAVRGQPSHFNTSTPANAAIWRIMGTGVILAMIAILALAVELSTRPLAVPPVVAFAIRIGIWMLIAAAISGVAMGGRGQHTVGAADGGDGMRLTNWSRSHGDLRVSHFLALHALQALPLVAIVATKVSARPAIQWSITLAAMVAWIAAVIAALLQALAGRPSVW